ncbi:MAG: GFA family protein [Pseudoxanthomonas sp.]
MKHAGSCHCGAIAFELEAEIEEVADCNCSMCRRRGGLLWFGPRHALTLLTPQSGLSTYSFNKHHIQHHFCANCGISPFGEGDNPKTGTRMAAVNVRCLPDLDLKALKINEFDGASL